jgi:type II secretory pathway pseudopilin PulG
MVWSRRIIKASDAPNTQLGFTVTEILVVAVLLGLVAVLAVPGWLHFTKQQRLKSANQMALAALRKAQAEAIRTKEDWNVGFRELNNRIEVAVYPAHQDPDTPGDLAALNWTLLPNHVVIDPASTFYERTKQKLHWTQFDDQGHARLGRIVFKDAGSNQYRCVFVSTLLGAMRTTEGKDCLKKS